MQIFNLVFFPPQSLINDQNHMEGKGSNLSTGTQIKG